MLIEKIFYSYKRQKPTTTQQKKPRKHKYYTAIKQDTNEDSSQAIFHLTHSLVILQTSRQKRYMEKSNRQKGSKKCRVDTGRTPEPSYGLIDSQSVKTANKNERHGIDGEKS
jgi:hypothetical protein